MDNNDSTSNSNTRESQPDTPNNIPLPPPPPPPPPPPNFPISKPSSSSLLARKFASAADKINNHKKVRRKAAASPPPPSPTSSSPSPFKSRHFFFYGSPNKKINGPRSLTGRAGFSRSSRRRQKKKRTGFGLRGSFKVRMWVGGLSCSDSNNPAGRKTRRRRERESLRHSMEGDYPVSIRETSRLRDCCVYMPPLYDLSEVFQGVGCAATGVIPVE
ncbi:hypothetical protein T310_2295 [Rasamsonia emersonii CBS 393.64]|uniref:Uncharacterized protein n=1 Tax=Rasamsonia emersonii (strain ATCC 16479 / CBS 393.64 / IMI 116815) TaxID=1408163 RepID=A0A0F4YZG6_RASE3|nr:hypothetical protein T310_2295 [Rasamsonia emersonii CBS 393.64]KKA23662.1 hypothetical protein T310_2295 [Rasamsonia emersonii CBS 393.64]